MMYANLLFLLLFLILHILSQTLIPSPKGKNLALLGSSLLVYLWAGPIYILIPLILTVMAWFLGSAMPRQDPRPRRIMLIAGVAVSAAVLVIFKYTDFLLGSVRSVFGVPAILPEILVPFGIGVYTLRLISYLVDVCRGDVTRPLGFLDLLTYSTLVYGSSAGPLMKAEDVTRQLRKRKTDLREISRGISRICLGIGKKYLLADSLATLVDQYLVRSGQGLRQAPVTGLWLGVILSALRWYLMFSAYADVAVGLGLTAGLKIEENFDHSLCSLSVTKFLSKWFISPGAFFKKYVGSTVADRFRSEAIGSMVCLALMGLWFGGSWTFALWGVWVAVALVLESRYISRLGPVVSGLLGMAGIFMSFVFLSFTTMGRLGRCLMGLVGLNGNGFYSAEFFAGLSKVLPLILACILFAAPIGTLVHNLWRQTFKKNLTMLTVASVWEAAWPLILLALALIRVVRGESAPFLTF